MPGGRPKQPIILTEQDHQQLTALAHSRSLPHGLVMRARLLLMAAEGRSNAVIAEKLALT